MTTYVLFPSVAPWSVGASKLGAEIKLKAPPAAIVNLA